MQHLVIQFSNENDMIDALIGPSTDGRNIDNDLQASRVVIPGSPHMLAEVSIAELVGALGAAIQLQMGDKEPFIRGHAARALSMIEGAHATGVDIVYNVSATSPLPLATIV